MPSTLPATRATNAKLVPAYRSVAVFVGGTSGIGAAMARAFAQHTNGNAHIIIVGRNRAAAAEVIASFPVSATKVTAEFVECDATLMRNVKAVTDQLGGRLPKVNFLVLSAGMLTLQARNETDEGIDKKLALHYYSRWKFIDGLMPLLKKAKDSGEDAKVMSILHSGRDKEIDVNDLGLKNTYTTTHSAMCASTYNNLMVESFAEKNPDMAFTHMFPGLVRTPILLGTGRDWTLRLLSPIMVGLSYAIGISADECAEYMLFALYTGKNGAYRKGRHGEEIGGKSHNSDEARAKLWEHTVAVTSV